MIDAVSASIAERGALDRGFSRGVALSVVAHLALVGVAVGATLLRPRRPVLQVMDGTLIALPPGGGGPSRPQPAPAQPTPQQAPPAAQPEPAPKIVKPPKAEPKRGLPEPDAKRSNQKPEKTPAPSRGAPTPDRGRPPAASTATGAYSGLDLVGPAGPGIPGGTDPMGDWYLAGVQRKIWMIWTQQIRSDFSQSVTVTFTILADGSLDPDVRVIQSSGASLLDNAAKRAVYSAAPFAPLPKDYGTNRFTIQAVFKPTATP